MMRLLMMDSRSVQTCRVLYQNKFEKQCILFAFIIINNRKLYNVI